jgi:hypothetical protein
MPISKKPTKQELRNQQDEAAIQAVIHKGGSVASETINTEHVTLKNLQLRLYIDQIGAIDQILQKKQGQSRRRRQSRHSWLVEAIEEKIERES